MLRGPRSGGKCLYTPGSQPGEQKKLDEGPLLHRIPFHRTAQRIKSAIRDAQVIGADETGWRIAGSGGWINVAKTRGVREGGAHVLLPDNGHERGLEEFYFSSDMYYKAPVERKPGCR
jgi:hypothetical protein